VKRSGSTSAILAASAALLILVAPAAAQYMYLDTNGDGAHTDGDVIAPTGTTTVNVWLRTDSNRDGTPATCSSATDSLGIFSYVFVLQAVGGTFSWNTFENNPPNVTPFMPLSSPREYVSGYCLVPETGPGLRRLGTLTLSVASGAPSLLIVATTTLTNAQYTSFGTGCPMAADDHTATLGRDWFDTDGARYGGWVGPPTLNQPAAMTVSENETADQRLTVTDPDGSAVTVSRLIGPDYLSLRQGALSPETWSVHVAPGFSDAGDAIATLQASDGTGRDFRSFAIHVLNVNRAPVLVLPSSVFLQAGETKTFRFTASDPDNEGLTLATEGVPSYAAFEGPSFGQLVLRLMPSAEQPPETTTVRITVSDGALSSSGQLAIQVGPPGFNPVSLAVRTAPNPMRQDGVLIFGTRRSGSLRVTLHDLQGRVVRTLYRSSNAPAADYRIPIPIEGSARDGGRLASGLYVARIEGVDGVRTQKVVVMKRSGIR